MVAAGGVDGASGGTTTGATDAAPCTSMPGAGCAALASAGPAAATTATSASRIMPQFPRRAAWAASVARKRAKATAARLGCGDQRFEDGGGAVDEDVALAAL